MLCSWAGGGGSGAGGEVQLRPEPHERVHQAEASQVVRLLDIGAGHRGGHLHRGRCPRQHPFPGREAEEDLGPFGQKYDVTRCSGQRGKNNSSCPPYLVPSETRR